MIFQGFLVRLARGSARIELAGDGFNDGLHLCSMEKLSVIQQ
jgi:hypothetical protein